MAGLETNIFPINNLSQLSSQYQLHRVKGLSPDHSDYYADRQNLQKRLSYRLQNPVLVIESEGLPYLVVRSDMQYELPPRFTIARGKAVTFEPRHDPVMVDYTKRSPVNDAICIRFLQFAVQGEIRQHKDLWQTQSGHPFFKKFASPAGNNRERFSGFVVRPLVTHEGGIGLCVDVTSTTLSSHPLPTHIKMDQAHKWRGQRCIYRYGNQWFEIQIDSLSDLGYSEHLVPTDDDKFLSLQEFITQNVEEPLPPELAQLSPDASVIVYYNNRDEERAAPTPLCYPIYGTDDEETGRHHAGTILQPHVRREQILEVVQQYLGNLKMGRNSIEVSRTPLAVPQEMRMFTVPDLRFGNDKVLSVRQSEGALATTLDMLGKKRQELLMSQEAGFFVSKPLDQQYLIMPTSVYRSWGKKFADDVKREVVRQYPTGEYNPQVLHYDDSGKKTFVEQGRKIRKFIQSRKLKPGFAVIMIHTVEDQKLREEDQLAALVIRELRKQDIYSAVIHSNTGQESYEFFTDNSGNSRYQWSSDQYKRGKLSGYMRNVVLNKILLTNWRWPFILDTPLHADITIGIDVKNHTAGLVVVGKRGGNIRPLLRPSKQKEKLLDGQARAYLLEILKEEIGALTGCDTIRHIVIHRDGMIFDTEVKGIKAAINELKQEGLLPKDVKLTLLEIAKSSMANVRLFDVTKGLNRSDFVVNPQVGEHYSIGGTDAYLCSTGRAFERRGKQKGTSNPLHICYVEGELEFEKCLEDIYALTTLAWTRPEDCSRFPITIKLNDRFLRDEAAEYDVNELEFSYEKEEIVNE